MNTKQLLALVSLTAALFSSCQKEPNEAIQNPSGKYEHGVFVLNEGYDDNTGSISFFNTDSLKVEQNIFSAINNRAVGHFLQSMAFNGNNAYVVVNGNSKVEVLDRYTFKSTATISNFVSPRYFLPISSTKAYVSEWYTDSSIAVVDLTSNTIIKTFSSGGRGAEQMVFTNGRVFVGNVGLYDLTNFSFKNDSTLSVIDPVSDKVIKKITLGYQVNYLAVDKNNKLWVMTIGNQDYAHPENDTQGKLFKINSNSLAIEKEFVIGVKGDHPSKMIMDGTLENIYFQLNKGDGSAAGVMKVNIDANELPSNYFISKSFYGLGFDKKTNTVLGSAIKDYTSNGTLLRFNSNTAAFIDSFTIGVTPGAFYSNE